jgi:hypothetical protein
MENDRSHYLLGNWIKKWEGVQGERERELNTKK